MWSGAAVAKTASKLLCQTRVEGLTYKDAGVDIDEENNQDGFPNWRFWRALPFEYGDIHLVADTDEVETKLETGSHKNIGLDLAAISVNDIVHSRAKSFFFQILVLIEIFQSVCNLWIGLSFLSCTLVSKSFGFDRQLESTTLGARIPIWWLIQMKWKPNLRLEAIRLLALICTLVWKSFGFDRQIGVYNFRSSVS
ncbi:Phosphoribosylformylglycinamidine cyclo-ligase, chloroplastic/mitochondrial [Sesamum angolense]|uniref:Phosphoribosylformylglycinamidine cyclo-ligase, chloroplastic/mitochondrial n=1 Tax=Sesamum angolense TaxID=2727404 RepID=A0AAE1WEP7_9LAMI|nr:Phosphoribosylformylglycinamidine cyclo-ligase, chloroplastic/mitochondrial [Sesamum angolense]